MNEFILATILGIVEGLTEFLPVSSTGHLIIVGKLLGFTGEKAESFEIFIQLGAILAVLLLYYERFVTFLPTHWSDEDGGLRGLAGIKLLAVACLPVFILGFLLREVIREYLFSPLTVSMALVVGGILMIILERRDNVRASEKVSSLDEISVTQALLVGCAQCLALWPGMSRSASTIIGGLFVGLDRKAAAEFSFLVAVPVMFAATAYDMLKSAATLTPQDLAVFGVGFVVSFVVAVLAVKGFLTLLNRFTLEGFGWYRIAVGALVFLWSAGI